MNISGAFPSKYLKAADLNGKAHDLVMGDVKMEDVGGNNSSDDLKPVLYFKNQKKGIVLNRTNAAAITFVHGEETNAWSGKDIEVYPDRTPFNGNMVACIRVRVKAPEPSSEPSADDSKEEFDDDITF